MRVDKSKWHRDLLGNLCNIKRGGSPRPIQKFLTDAPDGINWIKIGDAGDSKFISSCKEKITPEGVRKSRFVHKGDFLLSNSMSFGRPYILNVDGCIHDGWLVLEQPKQFDKSYLYYLLGSAPMYERFAQKAQGAVVNNLNIDRVASVEVIYPPLDIQQAIAAELDAVQAMIDGYKAQIADLDVLAQSIFVDTFGNVAVNDKCWDIIQMGQLGNFKNGLNYSKGERGKPLKIIGVGDFQNIKCISSFDNISYINIEDIPQEYLLHNEDIVFVRSNGNKNLVGRCLEVFPNSTEVTFSGFCIRFRKSVEIINKYLIATLTDIGFKNTHILKSNGIGIQNINQKLLGSLPIPVPPIGMQKKYATKVEAIEQQKELFRQQLADAETLMKERMQYYFS